MSSLIKMYVQPGIGDNLWVLERFHSWFFNAPRDYEDLLPFPQYQIVILPQQPQRAHQLFELLESPCIYSVRYADPGEKFPDGTDMTPERLMELHAIHHDPHTGWTISRHDPDQPIYMSINRHLESGYPIEEFAGGVSIEEYMWEMPTGVHDVGRASAHLVDIASASNLREILSDSQTVPAQFQNREKYPAHIYDAKDIRDAEIPENAVGIYMASAESNANWGFWSADDWVRFISHIGQHREYYFIGADYDKALAAEVIQKLSAQGYRCHSFFDNTLSNIIWLLRGLKALVAFPSGIPIIAATIEVNTIMFYPEHLRKMRYAWPPKLSIRTGSYVAPMMMPVDQAIKEVIRHVDRFMESI